MQGVGKNKLIELINMWISAQTIRRESALSLVVVSSLFRDSKPFSQGQSVTYSSAPVNISITQRLQLCYLFE